jgi:hypothetical protein
VFYCLQEERKYSELNKRAMKKGCVCNNIFSLNFTGGLAATMAADLLLFMPAKTAFLM